MLGLTLFAADLKSFLKMLAWIAFDEIRWSIGDWLSDLRTLLVDLRSAPEPDPEIRAAVAELLAALDFEDQAQTIESFVRVDDAIAQLRRAVNR